MAFSAGSDGGKELYDICLHTMGDDLPPSQAAVKYPKLARLFASVTLLVFAAVTLAWWVFLAWLRQARALSAGVVLCSVNQLSAQFEIRVRL